MRITILNPDLIRVELAPTLHRRYLERSYWLIATYNEARKLEWLHCGVRLVYPNRQQFLFPVKEFLTSDNGLVYREFSSSYSEGFRHAVAPPFEC